MVSAQHAPGYWPEAHMVRLDCHAVATTVLRFRPDEEGYKGGAFHSRFESALARVSSEAYAVLCERGPNAVKPYVLVPPVDRNPGRGQPFHRTSYPVGHRFVCSLILAGPAIRHAPAYAAAWNEAGHRSTKVLEGAFAVEDIEIVKFELPELDIAPGRARITLAFETMVRLHGGQRSRPAEFKGLVDSLLNRARDMPLTHRNDQPVSLLDTHLLQRRAVDVRIADDRTEWYDWPRYDPKKDRLDRYGGFVGSITYEGEIGPFVPLLLAGEWLHVGSHSAFGLGRYRIRDYEEEKP